MKLYNFTFMYSVEANSQAEAEALIAQTFEEDFTLEQILEDGEIEEDALPD